VNAYSQGLAVLVHRARRAHRTATTRVSGGIPFNLLTVQGVQQALNAIDLAKGAAGPPMREDGVKDAATTNAIMAFQRGHGLSPDGNPGLATRAYLVRDLFAVKVIDPIQAKVEATQDLADNAAALPAQAKDTLVAVQRAAEQLQGSIPSKEQIEAALSAAQQAAEGVSQGLSKVEFAVIGLAGVGVLYIAYKLFETRGKGAHRHERL
jgi:peptidoglycan hydrolase-like protein with peptidoglycan-binding domain